MFPGINFARLNMHVREVTAKRRQGLRDGADKRGRRGKPDAQFTGFPQVEPLCAGGGVVNHAQNLSAVGQKLPACRRQAHATVGAGEKTGANLLLQDLNLLAERRLRNVQARGGAAKMEFFCHRDKVA